MRQTTQISQIRDVIPGEHDFDVTVTYNNETVTVATGNDFLQYLTLNYWEWSFFSMGDTPAAWYNYLLTTYNLYMAEMSDSYDRIYAALMEVYDPTANYSRHSKESHKNQRTIGYGKSVETDYGTNGLTTTTKYGHSVTNKTTTFDNTANLRDANQTIYGAATDAGDSNTIKGKVSNTASGTDTITDTGLQNDNQRDETGLWRNTASENIETEIGMRIRENFLDIVIEGFVKKYLFLLA